MLALRRRVCPVDYSLCSQTVTIYHQSGQDTYARKVFTNAFLDFKKTQNVDKRRTASCWSSPEQMSR